jgi:CRISPR-associated protein Csm2
MRDLIMDISFRDNDKKLVEMFGDKALHIAEKLKETYKKDKPHITTTQFRKFYDKVLELNDKAQNLSQDEFEIKVLPFLKMLNSKVAYAKTRGVCGNNFEILMKESINKVSTPEELQNFKYFLESIIGFMPKK